MNNYNQGKITCFSRQSDLRIAGTCNIQALVRANSQISASLCSKHSWGFLPQPGTKRLGEGIMWMEDAGTSEEDNDIDSQDSNTPINHGHLARNCSIKIIWKLVQNIPSFPSHSFCKNISSQNYNNKATSIFPYFLLNVYTVLAYIPVSSFTC